MLSALTAWVEQGKAPQNLQLVEQGFTAPFAPLRSRPLCEWPLWPKFMGGDVNAAASFQCVNE
jgi:feruloyl esterase